MHTPNEFKGRDTERIRQAIDAAMADGSRRVVIPRMNHTGGKPCEGWELDSAILLPSGMTLELDDCRIRLSDRCRDNFIRSANCGQGIRSIQPLHDIQIIGRGRAVLEGAAHPRSTGDSAKTLGQPTYGTDAGVAEESQTGDWRNLGVLLARVERFRIENLTIIEPHCWGISLEHCSHGKVRDIEFASTGEPLIDGVSAIILNQDGLDLRAGCHDILIENITGYTGDDLVALTGSRHMPAESGGLNFTQVCGPEQWAGRCEDIRHITIRNVVGHSRGRNHIVRFLNGNGVRLHDVILDGLIDTSPIGVQAKAAVKIGDNNPAWGGITPLGDTFRLVIDHVLSRAREAVLVGGSLADSVIGTVRRHDNRGGEVFLESGPTNIRNVTIKDAGVK
jgi:hypothetical protein